MSIYAKMYPRDLILPEIDIILLCFDIHAMLQQLFSMESLPALPLPCLKS